MRQLLILITTSLILSACGGSSNEQSNTPIVKPPSVIEPQLSDGLPTVSALVPDQREHLSGGEATTHVFNQEAFGQRPQAIASDFVLDGNFTRGDHIFRTPEKHGIGPLFNEKTCQGCHIKDGRGKVPKSPEFAMHSMFLRISDEYGNPDPIYGDQIQTFGVESYAPDTQGLPKYNAGVNSQLAVGEAYALVEYETVVGNYADGSEYQLRKPIYKIKDLAYGEFVRGAVFSPRVTPAIFGSGLLEAIPEDRIMFYQDIDDANNDGISGRAAMVTSEFHQEQQLGRFGYKASNPSVLQQISAAFRGDIGLTNVVFNTEACTSQQTACTRAAEQEFAVDQSDISAERLALVEFYNRVLAVPARRGYNNSQWHENIVQGRTLFFEANCQACHVPRHKTGIARGSVLGELSLTGLTANAAPIDVLSNQIIYPFTDLLLHDMGGNCAVTQETLDGLSCDGTEQCLYVQRCDGLADNRPEGDASGTEWKTPPLWGLGLVTTVNPDATFLHDGRARTIEEAILWHGGEATNSLNHFKQYSASERELLLEFLRSL